jgi:hypothetical protein
LDGIIFGVLRSAIFRAEEAVLNSFFLFSKIYFVNNTTVQETTSPK